MVHIHGRNGNVFAIDYTLDDEIKMRYRSIQLLKLHNIEQQLIDQLSTLHRGHTVKIYHVVRCMS